MRFWRAMAPTRQNPPLVVQGPDVVENSSVPPPKDTCQIGRHKAWGPRRQVDCDKDTSEWKASLLHTEQNKEIRPEMRQNPDLCCHS